MWIITSFLYPSIQDYHLYNCVPFRKTVDDIVRSHEEGAKESKSGYQDVERNSLIKVTLTSPDVVIEDGEEEQKWAGKYLDFEFAAKIPNDFAEEQILFSATVYINDLIATKLKLILVLENTILSYHNFQY